MREHDPDRAVLCDQRNVEPRRCTELTRDVLDDLGIVDHGIDPFAAAAPEDRTGGFADQAILATDYLRAQRIRAKLCRALEVLGNKRDSNPPKKHGNIPL